MALSLSLTRNRPSEAEVAFIAATEILLACFPPWVSKVTKARVHLPEEAGCRTRVA
jgi:hypothetical protein